MVVKKEGLLKDIPASEWDKWEINWGNGDMVSWLQQLAQAIEKEGKLIKPLKEDNKEFEFVSPVEINELNKWQGGYKCREGGYEVKVNRYINRNKFIQKKVKLGNYN